MKNRTRPAPARRPEMAAAPAERILLNAYARRLSSFRGRVSPPPELLAVSDPLSAVPYPFHPWLGAGRRAAADRCARPGGPAPMSEAVVAPGAAPSAAVETRPARPAGRGHPGRTQVAGLAATAAATASSIACARSGMFCRQTLAARARPAPIADFWGGGGGPDAARSIILLAKSVPLAVSNRILVRLCRPGRCRC